jgi:S1-C subfamily serine protease
MTDDLKRGIVLIDATLDASTQSSGTGMILNAGGQVLTNYHVVRSSISVTVTVVASQRRYTATLIGRDALHDVALLQLDGATGMPTITPDSDAVAVGDPVVAAGNAAGQGYLSAFAGRILGTDRSIRVRGASASDPEENLSGLLETDAHAEPGDSGGPLFDAEAEVLGMTTAGSSAGSQGAAYAVPIANALAVVGKIRAGDETDGVVVGPKSSLGVNAVEDAGKGVRVTKVITGTAASRAGLKVGDYITSVAGQQVSTLAALLGALDTVQPGQTISVQWTRDGAAESSQVALDASKYN